jgi:hypothetical protein
MIKIDNVKGNFYGELECIFDKFLRYQTKLLLDFNAKVGRENIFKLTVWNESSLQNSRDNGVSSKYCQQPTIRLTIKNSVF